MDTQDQYGQNALQLAAGWYPGEVVERLFKLGASLSLFGQNPWKYPANTIWNAIYSNNTSSFQVLLQYYPDIDSVDRHSLRMLNYTARNGNVEMTSLLLKMGAVEIYPEYNTQDYERDSDSDTDDSSDVDGLEDWTEENYLTYLNTLERFGRVVIRASDGDDGTIRDIYWNANEDVTEWD